MMKRKYMTSAHSLWACCKVQVQSDNPEYVTIWHLSGPMGVRLKGFYCCSNAEFCNLQTAVISDDVQRCTDKIVTISMHVQFSTANLFVFHFQNVKCTVTSSLCGVLAVQSLIRLGLLPGHLFNCFKLLGPSLADPI